VGELRIVRGKTHLTQEKKTRPGVKPGHRGPRKTKRETKTDTMGQDSRFGGPNLKKNRENTKIAHWLRGQ